MMEIVFSFILTTWGDLAEVNAWAGEHLGGVHMLVSEVKRERQILCALERGRLLVYDGQWKEEKNLQVPVLCHKGLADDEVLSHLKDVQFRSETLLSTPTYSPWDQKVDIKIKDQPAFTLFIRQDKKYVGAHSTGGWSIWIERKTGHLRFEYMNAPAQAHFRLKAHGNLNPVKGGLTHIESIQALHVIKDQGKLKQAHILTGKKSDGFSHIVFKRETEAWKKTLHRCQETKSCKEPIEMNMDEERLNQFADISSKKYQDFVEKGRPLAFDKVAPEELVPPMALFR